MSRVIPPRPFLDAILVRSVVLWVALRGFAGLGSAGMGASLPQALIGPSLAAFYVFAVVLLVIRIEMARRSELIFLANLGYSFLHVSLVVAATCVGLEAILRIALV